MQLSYGIRLFTVFGGFIAPCQIAKCLHASIERISDEMGEWQVTLQGKRQTVSSREGNEIALLLLLLLNAGAAGKCGISSQEH